MANIGLFYVAILSQNSHATLGQYRDVPWFKVGATMVVRWFLAYD